MLLSGVALAGSALVLRPAAALANVPGNAMHSPASANKSLAYDRVIRLEYSGSANGTLLATFEHSGLNGTASQYIIRQSTDDGQTSSTLATSSAGTYAETCEGTSGNKAIAGSTGWTDYTLQGDVEITSGTPAGFLVRVSNPFTGTDALNGYYVGVTADANILGRENNSWTQLATTPIPNGLGFGTWYHLTVEAVGCQVTVTGQPDNGSDRVSLSYTDSCCFFTTGAVGVRTYNATATWPDVAVIPR